MLLGGDLGEQRLQCRRAVPYKAPPRLGEQLLKFFVELGGEGRFEALDLLHGFTKTFIHVLHMVADEVREVVVELRVGHLIWVDSRVRTCHG